MTPERPKISVCMPTYNAARFLGQALEGVLAQTYRDFEVIIYDDASTDGTAEVVARFGRQDPRVRYFRQAENSGVARNRNACLDAARGEYLAWLDSDDVFFPGLLARHAAVLDENPNVGLVHSAFGLIDPDGNRMKPWPRPFETDAIESGRDAFRELSLSNYIMHAVTVRRGCYDAAGRYAPEVAGSEDWEMWMRIALGADLAYIAEPLSDYRQHPGSLSAQAAAGGRRLATDVQVIRRVFHSERGRIADYDVRHREANAALAIRALIESGNAFTLGRRAAAVKAVGLALRMFPPLLSHRSALPLLWATVAGREYDNYRRTKHFLRALYPFVEASRFGARVRKQCVPAPEWEQELAAVAARVREVVPPDAPIATVDKYDPTLLNLCGRRGWHFPDRRLSGGGYPSCGDEAVVHLEQLREAGARFLVLPPSAFWWLTCYTEFRQHLDERYGKACDGQECVIYELTGRSSVAPVEGRRATADVLTAT